MQIQTCNSKALIFKYGFLQLPVRASCSCRAAVVPCHLGIAASESGEMLGEPFPLGGVPTAPSNFQTKELSSHSSPEKLLPPKSSPKAGLRQRGESPLLSHVLPWHCHRPLGAVQQLPGTPRAVTGTRCSFSVTAQGRSWWLEWKSFQQGFGVVFCTHVLGVYTGLERED